MDELRPKRHRRSVFLDEEQWAALSEAAKAEDRSINSVVRRLIDNWRSVQPTNSLVMTSTGPDRAIVDVRMDETRDPNDIEAAALREAFPHLKDPKVVDPNAGRKP